MANFLRVFLVCVICFGLFQAADVRNAAYGQVATKAEPSDWAAEIIASGAAGKIIKQHLTKLQSWTEQIDGFEKTVSERIVADDKLRQLLEILEQTRGETRTFVSELRPKLDDSKAKLSKLGQPPKDGEPQEAATVTAERQQVGHEVTAYDGLIKRAELIFVKTGQLIDAINKKRRRRFTRRLLKPAPDYYSPAFWQQAFQSVSIQNDVALKTGRQWIEGVSQRGAWRFGVIIGLALAAAAIMQILVSRLIRWPNIQDFPASATPSLAERGARALRKSLLATIPVITAATLLYVGSVALGVVAAPGEKFLLKFAVSITSAGLMLSAIQYSLLPRDSAWRLYSLSQASARRLATLLSALAVFWFADQLLESADRALVSPSALITLRHLTVSILFAACLLLIISMEFRREDGSLRNQHFRGWPGWIFAIIVVLVTSIGIADVLGYVALGRFIAVQIVETGSILFFIYLIHQTADYIAKFEPEAEAEGREPASAAGRVFSRRSVRVIASLFLDLTVLVVGIPLILLQWGFDWADIRSWISSAFFGFQIGGITISLQSILIALFIFVLGLLMTRIVQRWFMHRSEIAQQTDTGLRDSIRAVLGYAGVLLSTIVAASFLGIDFTSIAIVAGALSVGIGFGLQSVVNNFVSGLILLAERPIKVGDWIIVGSEEGFVQRISVRATEIRTFDRSSVIIPNSELITGRVTNWTLGNTVGRVLIEVGVSYSSDPQKVYDILLEVGKNHPKCLTRPEPKVVFENFGDSALEFSLRVYIPNVMDAIEVRTELRVAITKAFREASIEIPFPQRDIHIKEMPTPSANKPVPETT